MTDTDGDGRTYVIEHLVVVQSAPAVVLPWLLDPDLMKRWDGGPDPR